MDANASEKQKTPEQDYGTATLACQSFHLEVGFFAENPKRRQTLYLDSSQSSLNRSVCSWAGTEKRMDLDWLQSGSYASIVLRSRERERLALSHGRHYKQKDALVLTGEVSEAERVETPKLLSFQLFGVKPEGCLLKQEVSS